MSVIYYDLIVSSQRELGSNNISTGPMLEPVASARPSAKSRFNTRRSALIRQANMLVALYFLSVVAGLTRGRTFLPLEHHVGTGCLLRQDKRIQDLEAEIAQLQKMLDVDLNTISRLEETQQWTREIIYDMTKNIDIINDVSRKTDEVQGQVDDVPDVPADDAVQVLDAQADIPFHACTDQDNIRLVGGSNSLEGTVQVMSGGIWYDVCEKGWSQKSAQLVCSMLGHPGHDAAAVGYAMFGSYGRPMLQAGPSCSYSAGVICGSFDRHPLRIVGGSHLSEGRVEIQLNNVWGTVQADTNWGWQDAKTVCRMLGFTGVGATATTVAIFPQAPSTTSPVWMTGLMCQGNEDHVLECPTNGLTGSLENAFSHSQDAGVICSNWHYYPVRLADGANQREGRVEISINGHWSSVNAADWDDTDARVICRMLGYDWHGAIATYPSSGGTGAQLLGYVRCEGSEEHILQCPTLYALGLTTWNDHQNDAGVRCRA